MYTSFALYFTVNTLFFNDSTMNQIYKDHLLDVLDYAINKASLKTNEVVGDDDLVYYRKYSRKDVFKIMNFDEDQNPQMLEAISFRKLMDVKNVRFS